MEEDEKEQKRIPLLSANTKNVTMKRIIYFYFEKKMTVCRTIISYKLKTTANNTLRSCLAFAISDYDTFILSAGIYQFCFFLWVKLGGEEGQEEEAVPFFFCFKKI